MNLLKFTQEKLSKSFLVWKLWSQTLLDYSIKTIKEQVKRNIEIHQSTVTVWVGERENTTSGIEKVTPLTRSVLSSSTDEDLANLTKSFSNKPVTMRWPSQPCCCSPCQPAAHTTYFQDSNDKCHLLTSSHTQHLLAELKWLDHMVSLRCSSLRTLLNVCLQHWQVAVVSEEFREKTEKEWDAQ